MSKRIIRLKEVIDKTSLSSATIYRKMDSKSDLHDPEFPQKVSLGGRAVGWVESEVDEWIERQISNARQSA